MNNRDVSQMRQVAFLFSQSVAALITLEAMKVANQYRVHRGEVIAYNEEAFNALLASSGVEHNDAILTLRLLD